MIQSIAKIRVIVVPCRQRLDHTVEVTSLHLFYVLSKSQVETHVFNLCILQSPIEVFTFLESELVVEAQVSVF